MRPKEITIGKTRVGGDNPVFIIAEIGINFDGKFNQALALIDSAVDAGCNAVKFQLFTAERMYTKKAGTYKTASGKRKDIIQIVKEGELPTSWIPKLKRYANSRGVEFFSTVCDEVGADILAKYNADAYKFASYEITHLPLFSHVAKKQKPIIFSSGGATLKEVAEAIETIKKEGNKNILLNHCIGQYPAPLENLNLNVIKTFQLAFPDVVIGYSDHSSDPVMGPRTAVALGAKAIEKHITLDRNLPGPDHSFAVNPKELARMVRAIREAEKKIKTSKKIPIDQKLLGTSERKTYEGEAYVRSFAYRSLFTKKPIKKGEKFTKKNIAVLRPGKNKQGIEPAYFPILLGKRAAHAIPAYAAITWNHILPS